MILHPFFSMNLDKISEQEQSPPLLTHDYSTINKRCEIRKAKLRSKKGANWIHHPWRESEVLDAALVIHASEHAIQITVPINSRQTISPAFHRKSYALTHIWLHRGVQIHLVLGISRGALERNPRRRRRRRSQATAAREEPYMNMVEASIAWAAHSMRLHDCAHT